MKTTLVSRVRSAAGAVFGRDPALLALSALVAIWYVATPGVFEGKASGDGLLGFRHLTGLLVHRSLDLRDTWPERSSVYAAEPATGRVANPAPIGAVIFWLPPYVAGLGVERALGVGARERLGYVGPGESRWLYFCAGLGSLACALAGFARLFAIARRYASLGAARFALVASVLGSPLFWYSTSQPLYQHACAFFAVTLLVERSLEWQRSTSSRQWAALGFIAALAISVRTQEALWTAVPALLWVRAAARAAPEQRGAWARAALVFAVALALGLLPQFAVWKYFYGSFRPAQPAGHFHWSDPAIVEALFSTRSGVFACVPLAYLALLGWIVALRQRRAIAFALVSLFVLELWVNASAWDYHGSWSCGPRRFTDATLVLTVGLALVWDLAGRRTRLLLAAAGAIAASSELQYTERLRVERASDTSHRAERHSVKLRERGAPEALSALVERAGSPFVQPAGWLFALRYRVRPSAFESIVGTYAFERDWRDRDALLYRHEWSLDDAPEFIVQGAIRSPTGARSAEGSLRILVPMMFREGFRLVLRGTFEDADRVVARCNGQRVFVGTSRERIEVDVPRELVRTRASMNELTVEGVRSGSLLDAIGFWPLQPRWALSGE